MSRLFFLVGRGAWVRQVGHIGWFGGCLWACLFFVYGWGFVLFFFRGLTTRTGFRMSPRGRSCTGIEGSTAGHREASGWQRCSSPRSHGAWKKGRGGQQESPDQHERSEEEDGQREHRYKKPKGLDWEKRWGAWEERVRVPVPHAAT